MAITLERISILCVNFYSALAEKNYLQLEGAFPNTCFIAKLTNLAESLRTNIPSEAEIKADLADALCQKFGFYGLERYVLEKLQDKGIIKIERPKIEVLCKDQKNLLQIMGGEWINRVKTQTPKNQNECALIELMEQLSSKPLTKHEMDEILKNTNKEYAKSIITILENLNLLICLDSFNLFCSPETFGTGCKEDIVSKLSEFKIDKKYTDLINTIQNIKENPAVPLEFLPNQELVKELSMTGFLEPYGITVGGRTVKFLFSGDLKADDLYLTKETAAHFRYANTYAEKKFGRLEDPVLFLTKLIEKGHSGAATNIGTDYNSLILNRVIRIEKGGLSGRYMMYPVKEDILEGARNILSGLKPFKPKFIDTKLTDFTKNPPETRLDPEMQTTISKICQEGIQNLLKKIRDV